MKIRFGIFHLHLKMANRGIDEIFQRDYIALKKEEDLPWLIWLNGLSTGMLSKGLPV